MKCVEETASRLPRVDQAAYTLNCFYQIHSSLSLYDYVDDRLESLRVSSLSSVSKSVCVSLILTNYFKGLMENQLAILSTEQATSLIHSLGLGPVCSLLQNQGEKEILSNIPGMDPSSLQSFLVRSQTV